VNKNHSYISGYTPALRPQNVLRDRLNSELLPSMVSVSQTGQSPTPERSLSDYLKIAIKYKNLIIATTSISFLIAVIYCVFATKLYTSTATLRISTYLPVLPGNVREDVLRQQTAEDNYFATQVAELKSLPLADTVLSLSNISKLLQKYYNQDESDKQAFSSDLAPLGEYRHSSTSMERYLKLLRIEPVSETSLVKISATTVAPDLSAKIANTHAEQFIQMAMSDRKDEDSKNVSFLQSQVEELALKIQTAEDSLADYARKHALVSMENDDRLTVNKVDSTNRLLEQAIAKRIEVESRYAQAKEALKSGLTMIDDVTIEKLREQLSLAEAEYSELGQRFTGSYPKMKELRFRINNLKNQIALQREQALNTLDGELKAAYEVEKELQNQVNQQRDSAFEVAKAQVEYNRMKREYESLKELYQNVLMELQQTQLSSGGASVANLSISEYAAIPDRPSSPKKGLALALSLFCGPIIGLAIAFIAEALDKTIKSPEELEELNQAPGLGIIPNFDQVSPPNKTVGGDDQADLPATRGYPLVTVQHPFSLASESFRTVRAGVRLSSADKPIEVIVVTSSDSSEGKSALVANLGVVCAQDNAKTLLIDADLRRPSLWNYFGLSENVSGLAEVLTDQAELSQVIKSTQVERLSILPAGGAVPNPAELIGSMKMSKLISFLREHFDYIIIDTPPIMPVSDSLILSREADGVIMVTRAYQTLREHARISLAKLNEGGARILGLVLNDVGVDASFLKGDYLIKAQTNPRYGNPAWDTKHHHHTPKSTTSVTDPTSSSDQVA
jgi:polysaccharide biosynthesis transport protein